MMTGEILLRGPRRRAWGRWAVLAGAATLALLAGCSTVGPDYKLPEQAVIRQSGAGAAFAGAGEVAFSQSDLPSHWWRLYRDPTLDGLIEKAFAANTDLRSAAANLARARAAAEEVRAAGQPAIGVNAAPAYGRRSAASLGLAEPLDNQASYDAGIGVSYQIDLFGKIARAVEAASADTESARAAYDLVRVTVAADTARAYLESCSAARQAEIARKSVQLQQRTVQLTEQRVKAGRGTALDTSRARTQLEQLRSAVPALQARHQLALYRLDVLTGELPGGLPAAVRQCGAAPSLSAPIPVGDGAALLRRRPDIRQAERKLAAATARIGVATADLYPSISLGLSAGSSGLLSQFGNANTFHWSLGPLISWTLPVTGEARPRIAQAEAGSQAALAQFDAAVLGALRETESALTAYARELDRNAALRAAREQSALASDQATRLFRYGRSDFLTVLDADRTLAAAESALAASDAELANDQVALFLALGGGWEQGGS